VQDRSRSQTCRLEHVAGPGIIASRRSNIAHLHRPWRAYGLQNHEHYRYGLLANNDGAQDVPITDDHDGLIVGIDDRVDTGLASILSPLSSFAACAGANLIPDAAVSGVYNV
jgi:hypothetical protein